MILFVSPHEEIKFILKSNLGKFLLFSLTILLCLLPFFLEQKYPGSLLSGYYVDMLININ